MSQSDNTAAFKNRLDGELQVPEPELNWIENLNPLPQTNNQINQAV